MNESIKHPKPILRKSLRMDSISADTLNHWYNTCQPGGSAPNALLRMICALIEELAEAKDITLIQSQRNGE